MSKMLFGVLGVGLFVTTAVIAAPKLGGKGTIKVGSFKPDEARKRFKGALDKGKKQINEHKKKREKESKEGGYGETATQCTAATPVGLEQIDPDKSSDGGERRVATVRGQRVRGVPRLWAVGKGLSVARVSQLWLLPARRIQLQASRLLSR
jgi:hypothetical protein